MTPDAISQFFSPKTIVIVGASQRENSLGQIILKNLLAGGVEAKNLSVVNPKYDKVFDTPCFAKVEDLPNIPDLAIIVSPAQTIPQLIDELGVKGV